MRAAVLVAAALAGCGDDEGDSGSTGIEQAKAICAEAAPRAAKVLGAESIADFERYGREAAAVVRDMREELDEVDLGDAADGGKNWLAAIDADLKTYRLLELAGSVRNREAVLEQNAKLAAARPGKLARALGLDRCADVLNDAANTFDR